MKRGFRRTKSFKAPMLAREGESEDVVRKHMVTDPVFYEERTIDYHDAFGAEGYRYPPSYDANVAHGFLYDELSWGFGGAGHAWPFEFRLAMKNEAYRAAVRRAIYSPRYAAEWRVKADAMMAQVVNRLQTDHVNMQQALLEPYRDLPTLPQDLYETLEADALHILDVKERLRDIRRTAAAAGWLDTAREIGYNNFLIEFQNDRAYTQSKEIADMVNAIKKEMETVLIQDSI